MLSRGFTVEGLLVTYLSRPIARIRVVDVVQQRGRFFGYRRNDLSLTRVFLEDSHREMYHNTIDHHDHMLSAIERFEETGEPFTNFKRRLLLDPRYRPTRSSIISDPTSRGGVKSNIWYHPLPPYGEDYSHHRTQNRELWESFVKRQEFDYWNSEETSATRRHRFVKVRLKTLLDELLTDWSVPSHNERDPRRKDEILFYLSYWLDQYPGAESYVFQMRPGVRRTFRSLRKGSATPSINPHSDGSMGVRADRNIKRQGEISVQIAYYSKIYSDSTARIQIGNDLYGLSFNLGDVPRGIFEVIS